LKIEDNIKNISKLMQIDIINEITQKLQFDAIMSANSKLSIIK